MSELQSTWQQVLAALGNTVSAPSMAAFITPLRLVAIDGNRVTLHADSQFTQETVSVRWGRQIREAFIAVLGRQVMLGWATVDASEPINNINNININCLSNIKTTQASSDSSQTGRNKINNINRDYRGLKARINSDPDFVAVLDEWKVDEPFLYAACRDLGESTVKGIIFRLRKIRDGYFRENYGPIPEQRGRLLNKEIRELRAKRKAS